MMAIGNPFDFSFSTTVGVVSALGRRGLAAGEIQNFIQTDAAVNPGNSGGPLINLDGQVVGINTAIYSAGQDQNSGIVCDTVKYGQTGHCGLRASWACSAVSH